MLEFNCPLVWPLKIIQIVDQKVMEVQIKVGDDGYFEITPVTPVRKGSLKIALDDYTVKGWVSASILHYFSPRRNIRAYSDLHNNLSLLGDDEPEFRSYMSNLLINTTGASLIIKWQDAPLVIRCDSNDGINFTIAVFDFWGAFIDLPRFDPKPNINCLIQCPIIYFSGTLSQLTTSG